MPWNGVERELRAAVRIFRVSGEGRAPDEHGSPAAGGGAAVFGVVKGASRQDGGSPCGAHGVRPYHGRRRVRPH